MSCPRYVIRWLYCYYYGIQCTWQFLFEVLGLILVSFMFLFAYLLESFYILVYFSFLLDMPGFFLLRAGASVLVVFGLARRVSFVFLVIFYFNNFWVAVVSESFKSIYWLIRFRYVNLLICCCLVYFLFFGFILELSLDFLGL